MEEPPQDYIYCYPGTDVLKNLFSETNPAALEKLERMLTGARLIELLKNPLRGNFDSAHLRRIHRHIFQDLYGWAGEYRTVDIAKGYYFCRAEYLARETDRLLLELRAERYLKNTAPEKICERAAYYLGEINAIHPFRDGNGRTQREFIRELLLPLGYKVDYSKVNPAAMRDASIASFAGDNALMIALMKQCTIRLQETI